MGGWDVVKEEKIDPWSVVEERTSGPEFNLPPGAGMPQSAVTGQPVQTDAERMMTSKRAMAEVLPIAGDIVATAAAPQFAIPAKGAGIVARGLPMLGNLALRAAGSGAGSVVGEVEKQALTEQYDPNQVIAQGVAGAGGEVGLSGIGAGLKVAKKPALELMSDLTLSGGRVKQVLTDKLKKQADDRAVKFITDIAPESVKGRIDDVGLASAINEAMDSTKAMYAHFKDALETAAEKNSGVVNLEKTRNALRQWYEDIADPGMVKAGKVDAAAEREILKQLQFPGGGVKDQTHIAIRRLMRGEDLEPREVNYLFSKIYPKKTQDALDMYPKAMELRQTFKETMLQDLDDIGVAAGKRSADETFKEIKRYESVKNIYDRSTVVNRETGERKFLPYKFVENVQKNERMLRTTMPETWEKLKVEAEYYRDVADRISRGERNLGGPLMLSGLASSYFTGGVPVAEAFGAASAWSLMSKNGQKALDGVFKYFVRPAAKGGLHMGATAIKMQPAHKEN